MGMKEQNDGGTMLKVWRGAAVSPWLAGPLRDKKKGGVIVGQREREQTVLLCR